MRRVQKNRQGASKGRLKRDEQVSVIMTVINMRLESKSTVMTKQYIKEQKEQVYEPTCMTQKNGTCIRVHFIS